MAYTSIIDFRHLLDPCGSIPARPSPVARRASHLARIVECATSWPAGWTLECPVQCRCRPERRPCTGRPFLRRSEVPEGIVWICPHCGDCGMVQGYTHTRWDLSGVVVPEGGAQLQLTPREYDALWSDQRPNARRAMIARAEVLRGQLVIQGPEHHIEALRVQVPQLLERRARARRVPRGRRILELRVRLQRVRPPVWRTLQLPATATLAQLHRVIQCAMGWTDAHEHRFRKGGAVYGNPAIDPGPGPVVPERQVRIGELLTEPGERMSYEYDLSTDRWVHDIRLEGMGAPEQGVRYPVCVTGRRACPPEDIGGPHGFARWLERRAALTPPPRALERHLHALEIDPEHFDVDETNRALRRVRVPAVDTR